MNRLYRPVLLVACALLPSFVVGAGADAPPAIESAFFGYADFDIATTYAWIEGLPARDPSFERKIRTTIDAVLTAKGWQLSAGEADIYLRTEARGLAAVSAGFLRIEAIDGPSKNVAWRCQITDVVTGKREKFMKLLDKTLRKAFKEFPKVRASKVR